MSRRGSPTTPCSKTDLLLLGLPRFELTAEGDTLELRFAASWLDKHPLSRVDLEEEDAQLAETGVRLRIVTQ